jgi:hypothetical protein
VSTTWQWYLDNREAVQPLFAPLATLLGSIVTLAVGVFLALAALRQARTATARHIEQTLADKQRRITESYSKAVSQLASDKLEERLGGIFTLERISKESADDYWAVMETPPD